MWQNRIKKNHELEPKPNSMATKSPVAQLEVERGGVAGKPLVVSCAPDALGKVLLRANPHGNNWSLSGPIIAIRGNYTTLNGQ